jgi:hypothetical protein
MPETVETTIDSKKLAGLMTLPAYFYGRMVAVTVRLVDESNSQTQKKAASPAPLSDSFGMWKDRKDMDDVDAYIDNLRKGRNYSVI